MELRDAMCFAALLSLTAISGAATLPAGSYGCYTYNPKPNFVGEISITGGRYTVARFGTDGHYEYDSGSGRVAWRGAPPMGFESATLETDPTSGRKILRMYPKSADAGNKWKAAVCTPKESVSVGSATSSTASSGVTSGAARSVGFKPGDKVTAEFIGVPYPATIVTAEATRVRIKYDDPKSKDEWVDVNRIKPRK